MLRLEGSGAHEAMLPESLPFEVGISEGHIQFEVLIGCLFFFFTFSLFGFLNFSFSLEHHPRAEKWFYTL